jgi:putative hemolysin
MDSIFEGAVIVLLILINSWLSLSEMAVVASRKLRLRQWIKKGNKSAEKALFLSENTSIFLSSIQIGITLLGIFLGVFSGSTLVRYLSAYLSGFSFLHPWQDLLSFVLITIIITFLMLIFGELIPKKIALNQPEKMAIKTAGSMLLLSSFLKPIVFLLSKTTDLVLRLFHVPIEKSAKLSEEEIRETMLQGRQSGIFDETEYAIIERVLRLGDRDIQSIMVPRRRMSWINIHDDPSQVISSVLQASVSHFPVCDGQLDKLMGVVRSRELLLQWNMENKINYEALMQTPLFIYEHAGALTVLEQFRKEQVKIAFIVDEYGVIQGLVSFFDYLKAMLGEDISVDNLEPKTIQQLDAMTYEVDGMVRMDQVLNLFKMSWEEEYVFLSATIGGFLMEQLGRIPKTGEKYQWNKLCFLVKEMHQYRIHRVIISMTNRKECENAK